MAHHTPYSPLARCAGALAACLLLTAGGVRSEEGGKDAAPADHPAGWKRLTVTLPAPNDSVQAVAIPDAFERCAPSTWTGWLPAGGWLKIAVGRQCQCLRYEGQARLFIKDQDPLLLARDSEQGDWKTVGLVLEGARDKQEPAAPLEPLPDLKSVSLQRVAGRAIYADLLKRLNPEAVTGCRVPDVPTMGLAALGRLRAACLTEGSMVSDPYDVLKDLDKLEALDLSACSGGELIEPLAGLTGLLYLDVSASRFGHMRKPVSDLTSLAGMARLRALNLQGMGGKNADWSVLKDLVNLESLAWIPDAEGQRKYAHVIDSLPKLTCLRISGLAVSADGRPLLGLKRLTVLRAPTMPAEALRALADAGTLSHLRVLGWWPDDPAKLAGWGGLPALGSLELVAFGGLKDVRWLSGSPRLEHLRVRFLKGDAELRLLREARALEGLLTLDLTDSGAASLAPLDDLVKLRVLVMPPFPSPGERQRFEKGHPGCLVLP
jgi:hypothetical protein